MPVAIPPISNDELYRVYLDGGERPCAVTPVDLSVILQFWVALGATDRVYLEWAGAADDLGTDQSTVVDSGAMSLAAGVPYEISFGDADPGTVLYWRVGLSLAGAATIWGATRSTTTTPAATTRTRSMLWGDCHTTTAIARDQTNRGEALIRAAGVMAEAVTRFGITHAAHTGDGFCWSKGAGGTDFPIGVDGTRGGVSTYTLSQTDANRSTRIFTRVWAPLLAAVPTYYTPGNHEAAHLTHTSAETGGANDSRTWMLLAWLNHLGRPTDGLGSHYSAVDAEGCYSYRHGPALWVHLNIWHNTPLASNSPASLAPGSMDDTTLGATQWDWAFHASTGQTTVADPVVTPIIVLHIHNFAGGLNEYARSDGRGIVAKVGGEDAREWGETIANRGIHKAAVELVKRGFIVIVVRGHDHYYERKISVDGVVYLMVPQVVAGTDTGFEGWGYRDDVAFSAGNWLDTDETCVRAPSGGYLILTADPTFAEIEYRRVWAPIDGEDGPADGILGDHELVDRFRVSLPTHPRAVIRDPFDRLIEDTNTPVTPGLQQPAVIEGEPLSAQHGGDGVIWNKWSSLAGVQAYLRVTESEFDGATVLASRRPTGLVGVDGAKQTGAIMARLLGSGRLDRRVSVKARGDGTGDCIRANLLIAARNTAYTNTANTPGAGLLLRFGTTAENLVLRFDNAGTMSDLATASAAYAIPNGAAFDAGIIAELRGRVVKVWCNGTLRITHSLSDAIYAILRSPTDPPIDYVGLVAGASNKIVSPTGVFEFIDFEAEEYGGPVLSLCGMGD